MSGRVIQANFGGGHPRLSAVAAQPAARTVVPPPAIPGPPALVQPKFAVPSPRVLGRVGAPPPSAPSAPPRHFVRPEPAPPRSPPIQALSPAATLVPRPAPRPGATDNFPIDPVQLGLVPRGGRPLPPMVQAKMEGLFRQDLSAVRVHEGPQAARMGALAFTTGTDIYFAPGQYRPETAQGRRLLGHELAHVVQQRQGRVRAVPGTAASVVRDTALEAEAERFAVRAALQPSVAAAGVTHARAVGRHAGPRRLGAASVQRYESSSGTAAKTGFSPSRRPATPNTSTLFWRPKIGPASPAARERCSYGFQTMAKWRSRTATCPGDSPNASLPRRS
jgi:hypothetical protein